MCNQWVKCSDRMPQTDVRVLAFLPGERVGEGETETERVRIADYDQQRSKWYLYESESTVGLGAVSHWMPLPDAPDVATTESHIYATVAYNSDLGKDTPKCYLVRAANPAEAERITVEEAENVAQTRDTTTHFSTCVDVAEFSPDVKGGCSIWLV